MSFKWMLNSKYANLIFSIAVIVSILTISFSILTADDKRTICRDGVIVRSGPGNYFDLVVILNSGSEIVTIKTQEGWTKILVDGETGWISTNALKVLTDVDTTRISSDPSTKPRTINPAALTAMIKGFRPQVARAMFPDIVLPEEVRIPVGMDPKEVVSFRSQFETPSDRSTLTSREIEIFIVSDYLAISPLVANMQIERLGGRRYLVELYANMILLWIAEQVGAVNLAPYVMIADSGNSAFSYHGGWIVIGGELFDRLENEAELAAVIAHEFAHCIFNHSEIALQRNAWRFRVKEKLSQLDEQFEETDMDNFSKLFEYANYASDYAEREWTLQDELACDSAAVVWLWKCGWTPESIKSVLIREKVLLDQLPLSQRSLLWVQNKKELDVRIKYIDRIMRKLKIKNKTNSNFQERFRSNVTKN